MCNLMCVGSWGGAGSQTNWRKGLVKPNSSSAAKHIRYKRLEQSVRHQLYLSGLALLLELLAPVDRHWDHGLFLPTRCAGRPPNTLCSTVDSSLCHFRWVNLKGQRTDPERGWVYPHEEDSGASTSLGPSTHFRGRSGVEAQRSGGSL